MTQRLSAGEVCTRIVTIAYAGMAVSEAARLMREQHVGCLVVVQEEDPGRVVVGVLTDRDIAVSVVARDIDPRLVPVREVMTTDVATVREEDSMLDALELMRRRGVRRVPVTGPGAVLIGIVTLDDVLEIVAQELQTMAAAIGSARKHEDARGV